jgi:hypothetical protein
MQKNARSPSGSLPPAAITNDLLSKIRQAHSRLHRAYEKLKHRRRELTDDKARTKTAGAANVAPLASFQPRQAHTKNTRKEM